MARAPAPKRPKKLPGLPPGLHYEESGRIATITLDRPERLNALTFEIYEGLRDLFAALAGRPHVRAVILTGRGRGFCSGGDVEDIIGRLLSMKPKELQAFTTLTCDVIANMRACPQPIVAALNGVVAGAGAALAVASDFRVAVPEAKIAFLFVRAGLSGADMGACLLLPRLVGLGRAAELLFLGQALPADQAHAWGLYNRIVPPEHLMGEARELAERVARGPSQGIPLTKWSLDRELSMDLGEALVHDAKVQANLMTHPDFREAHEAFKAKREPRYA